MTSSNKIVTDIAIKMGVNSDNAIRKAEEFMRLLQLRMSGANSIQHLSDPCRVVLCLNLACNNLNVPFDKSDLTRLAGVNKKQYSNALHLVEKLLNLSAPTNVNSLCVQLGISEVAAFADKVLKKYVELHAESQNNKRPLDLTLPMYHCAAVFLACKHNKLKVNKPALVDAARIKRVQFDKILADFAPAVDKVKSCEVKKTATKRSHKLIELLDNFINDSTKGNEGSSASDSKNEEEDFDAWKKRILSEASEES